MTGALVIDLTREPHRDDESQERAKVAELDHLPDGARAIIQVGDRDYLSCWTVSLIHPHTERLLIEVQGSNAYAVERMVVDIRLGQFGGAA